VLVLESPGVYGETRVKVIRTLHMFVRECGVWMVRLPRVIEAVVGVGGGGGGGNARWSVVGGGSPAEGGEDLARELIGTVETRPLFPFLFFFISFYLVLRLVC
jgi:hypothetical protein